MGFATPDSTPGPALEEELQLRDEGADPSVVGALSLNAGELKAMDSAGVFNLRSGSGLTEAQHQGLRQLIHFIDEGPADGFATGAIKECLPGGSLFPTSEVWWESAAKTKKIVSLSTTWSGIMVTQEVWEVFDSDGVTVLVTVTDNIQYTGVMETSRTRSIA